MALVYVLPAGAHSSGCHTQHSCPSDHHTYVWYDSSGQGWDCAKPGAPEYDPTYDTTTITYGGYTYYCRAAGSAPPPSPQPTSATPPTTDAALACGEERWAVKTLSDPDVGLVNFTPTKTSVVSLRKRQAPTINGDTTRIVGVETTTFKVKAQLVEMKVEDDRDIHLVIAAPTNRHKTMIVEFPDTRCEGAATSPKKSAMSKARDSLTAACGKAIKSRFRHLRGTATITGVGFFDVIHGQTGVAPNGIELHPVLSFKSSDCQRT